MARRFFFTDDGFWSDFNAFIRAPRGAADNVAETVQSIIADVRANGGAAVANYTERFDRLSIDPEILSTDKIDIESLADQCPSDVADAIRFAHDRIAAYHAAQRPSDHSYTDGIGAELGWKWTAIDAVGVYVPGGRASYPSSVLMNVVPARLAGTSRIVMTAPAPDGVLNPAVAYAARIAGVDEFYPIGGAQAVAALAFGAGTLAPVDKIVGPGNAFVAEAKRHVFGTVGIDTIAGPSEICVIADGSANPDWVAADLLSQSEHDPSSQSILITTDPQLADAVSTAVERQLSTLETAKTAQTAWSTHGAIVVVGSDADALKVANLIAPEHLELCVRNADTLIDGVKHAGAVFVGHWAPEALGDYVTGSNHVLPTSRAARFSSGLGIYDFLKRVSIQRLSSESFGALSDAATTLAKAEGLPAHERSVSIRTNAIADG